MRSLLRRREAVLQASIDNTSLYLVHTTLEVDLRQLSFGTQPSLLPAGLLHPRCEIFAMVLRVIFFVFLLYFALDVFLLGSCAIRHYSSTRTTVAVPTQHRLESAESIAVHYLLQVASVPRTAATVRLVVTSTCTLRVSTFTSKPFSLLFVFFSLMRSPLMVLVSYIELLLTTADFAVEYVIPCIGTKFLLLIRKCVTSHVQAHSLSTGSFCFFVCCQIKSYILFSVYQYSNMNTSRIFFQIRRPGLHATAPYPIVSRVRKTAPMYT